MDSDSISLRCGCKINLSLDILSRREDGYHEMEMVMQSVDLAEDVAVTLRKDGKIALYCDAPAGWQIPCDERNIAWRAAEAFLKASGRQGQGLDISIVKRVPAQAGLGGGSADGAGVLEALNRLFGRPFTRKELCAIGMEVGADIPFCLTGGACLVRGKGERLTPLRSMPDCFILLVKPARGVSTGACFSRYDSCSEKLTVDTAGLVKALSGGDLPGLCQCAANVLEEAAQLPFLEELKDRLLASGALCAAMSGSGSAVFAVFEREEQARSAAREQESEGLWTCVCRPTEEAISPILSE